MPREDIRSAYSTDPADPVLRIGWSPERHVQIATLNLALHSRTQETTPEPSERSEDDPASGWFVTLDRKGCNDAIRILRRARDAAFGRDE